jgi:hypothetical protein
MHTAKKKKKNYRKRKARYSDKFLVAVALTPPRQYQKSNIFKSDAFKKGTMHKLRHRLIIDLRFSPAIVRHNQLRPDLRLSPCKVGP